jgi:hypothetical protein
MRQFSFYEQIAILIPGTVFLVAIALICAPDLVDPSKVDLGGFGLLVVIGYGAGHLMAAIGNLLETAFWRLFGGMPSDWVVKADPGIISAAQVTALQSQLRSRLSVDLPSITGMQASEWSKCFRQLYADVRAHRPGLVETFNGNYGMSRGLASALLAVLLIYLVRSAPAIDWGLAAIILAVAIAFIVRMFRFGRNFAREVLLNFINLPTTRDE